MAWGDLEGDHDADGILAQRRSGLKRARWAVIKNFLIVLSCAVWYSLTESPTALALEIIGAAWLAVSGIRYTLYRQFTMLMIVERRVHICEKQIFGLVNMVASLESTPHRTRF